MQTKYKGTSEVEFVGDKTITHHPSNKDRCPKCMDLWIKRENEMKGYTERTKDFWVKNGHETEDSFIKAIARREILGDKLVN